MPTHAVTRQDAVAIRAELEKAVSDVFAHFGLGTPQFSGVKYGPQFRVTITGAPPVLAADGETVLSAEALDYERYRESYGLKEGLVGKAILIRGKPFTFAGVMPNRPKYPLVFTSDDGKKVLYTTSVVAALNAAVTA